MFVAIERAAHLRVDAVRSDDQLGVMRDTVGKVQCGRVRPLAQCREAMPEVKTTAIDTARQCFEQIGPVEGASQRAEPCLNVCVIAIVERGAGVHVAG